MNFDFKRVRGVRRIRGRREHYRQYIESMHIQIQLTGENITIIVAPTDTVASLKNKIQNKTGIPPTEQQLKYAYQQLEDARTLRHYNINSDSSIHLVRRLNATPRRISVKTSIGNIIVIEVYADETIESVKEKIQKKEGFEPEHQCLLFNGQRLEDGRTVSDYNIQKELRLELITANLKTYL